MDSFNPSRNSRFTRKLSKRRESSDEYRYKKKEKLGQLYREGKTRNQKPIEVYDHDWESLAEGQVIPHGLYDLTYNLG